MNMEDHNIYYQNRKPFKLASRLRGMAKKSEYQNIIGNQNKTRQQREQAMYDEWCEYMETGISTTREVYNPKMGLGNEALYCRALYERYIE